MTEQKGCFVLGEGFPADRGLWKSRPYGHYWIRKAQESTECPICAQFQQERERMKKLETILRIIANISAVLQPAEKCQEILMQIHNEASVRSEA